MPHLILADYYSTIDGNNLQQVISDTDSYRLVKEKAAEALVKSYLVQKYDISQLLRETVKFSYTKTYKANTLVYLDGDAFSATATYSQYDIVKYSGSIYYAKTALTAGAWNASNFQLLGAQYDLFYIPAPYVLFDKNTVFTKDDYVFYKDKVYKCLRSSVALDHESTIQYEDYRTMPLLNDYPDAIGTTQWSTGVSYQFANLFPIADSSDYTAWSSGTAYTTGQRVSYNSTIYQAFASSTGVQPDSDITKWNPVSWVSGDNRNQEILECLIQITIYKLSSRISPRNVPDVWVKNYDDQIEWLKSCAKGDTTLDAPLIQTKSTGRIRWGSSPERINSY